MPDNFYSAISLPRYHRYLVSCGNISRKARKLYRANIELSKELYSIIGVFEVSLRNSIDRYMIGQKGVMWLEDAVSESGYLQINSGCERSFSSIKEAIHSLGPNYNHDRLIAKLTFGFWRYQFGSKEYAASGNILLNIFPNRPFGTKQKDVFKHLMKINDIRNRVAHYEPICFHYNVISTSITLNRYNSILELLRWMGYSHSRLLYGIDGVQKAIKKVNSV